MTALIASRYQLLDLLSEGDASAVWRAYDTVLDREIAVKQLRQGLGEAEATPAFLNEARTAARLHHPNILTVHDVVSDGGNVFIAMELIQGPTLQQLLSAGGPQPTATVRAIMAQTARALATAHTAGVVHRGLTADNVFWTPDGRAVVANFGVTRVDPDDDCGPEMDVAAWGALAYQLATGRTPTSGSDPTRDIPDDLSFARLIARIMASASGARPANGEELVRELSAPEVDDGAIGTVDALSRSRRSVVPMAVAAAAFVLVVGLVLALVSVGSKPDHALAPSPTIGTAATSTMPSTTTTASTTTTTPFRRTIPAGVGPLSPGLYLAGELRPKIAFELSDGWTVDGPPETEDHLFLIRRAPQPTYPWLLFAEANKVLGYDASPQEVPAPPDLAAWIRQHPRLTVRQTASTTIGGQPAVFLDVAVASAYLSPSCTRPCVLLLSGPNYTIRLHEGDRMRMYILTVQGRQVAIVVEAPADQFDVMLPTAEAVIRTVSFPG